MCDILFVLFLQDVDDIVDRNPAKQFVRFVRHGERHDVVLFEDLRDFLLVNIRRHADHVRAHQLVHAFVRRIQQKLLERDGSHQNAHIINHVDVIDVLMLFRQLSHRADRLLDRVFLIHDGDLLRHDATGGILVVTEKLLDIRGVFHVHRLQHDLGLLIREFSEDVCSVVGIHLTDQLGKLGLRHRAQQVLAVRVIEIEKDLAGDFIWNELEDVLRFLWFMIWAMSAGYRSSRILRMRKSDFDRTRSSISSISSSSTSINSRGFWAASSIYSSCSSITKMVGVVARDCYCVHTFIVVELLHQFSDGRFGRRPGARPFQFPRQGEKLLQR